MIAISDLVKRYGTFTAVDGVSLEAKGGEIHGFLGPNGAGETTTIRMIAGLLKPTAGRIVVNDHDLATNPVGPGVARVHPRPSVHLRKADGRRVSAISRGALRHQRHSVGPRVHETLDLFKLGDWEQELVESFSHGMKQRLVMSAAFLHRPDAVLVDEPMVGLDPRGARLIKHVFRRMSEHGVAILMSTHTLEVAQEMCDRISIIVKGKIIAERGRAAGAGRRRGPAAHPRVPEADRRQRSAGDRRRCLVRAPWRPFRICCCRRNWSSVNRARRREPGDLLRTAVFGAIGIGVMAALFFGAVWLTLQLDGYDELGDFLLRLGLSWLFLTFLSFLAFSGVVTALSTFFLSDDLRLLLAAPVDTRRLFHARFARTVGQSSWMVVVFLLPVLAGVGVARCAPAGFYLTAGLAIPPFVVIPVALGAPSRSCWSTSFRRGAPERS